MSATAIRSLVHSVADHARPLHGTPSDFDLVLDIIADASIVLIGEASHGTHEFYRIRAEITKRLITERGFIAVAAEADWPDAYRINRYVRNASDDADATEALAGFRRFPQWMWRNADVLDFVGWLRQHNDAHAKIADQVGFYGLDLYSLHASIEAVLTYLRMVDPDAARRAAQRYACFDHAPGEPQEYGYAATMGLTPSCERAVVEQLVELRRSAGRYASRDGRIASDDLFYAEQNARLVKNAEEYYRAMVRDHVGSWNLRDRHMAETLEELRRHTKGKIVVWAHNSHVGDARATGMTDRGELNIGQLARQRYGEAARTIGFTTYSGTVTAASDWDGRAERKRIRPALPESYEALFHATEIPNFAVDLRRTSGAAPVLERRRLERAIGVIYRPDTERQSHYFPASLPRQFDAVLHYDITRAVEPLERTGTWDRGELPETYPSTL
ncbi:MAG TPA: erythromycin esterase family protein [Gemmatimonadaceae bacterium]|nr:erythromycin esterase family protein [Gemmatimonadaceae bacterium]